MRQPFSNTPVPILLRLPKLSMDYAVACFGMLAIASASYNTTMGGIWAESPTLSAASEGASVNPSTSTPSVWQSWQDGSSAPWTNSSAPTRGPEIGGVSNKTAVHASTSVRNATVANATGTHHHKHNKTQHSTKALEGSNTNTTAKKTHSRVSNAADANGHQSLSQAAAAAIAVAAVVCML